MRRLGGAAAVAAVLLLVPAAPALAADRDGDGLRDDFEQRYGMTSPDLADTDHDGILDSAEDSDGDGLSDRGEQRFGTDPSLADSNGDGTLDSAEDSDGDGVPDGREQDHRPIPRGLRPSLARAGDDAQPSRERCQTWERSDQVTTCHLGDTQSQTRIVLSGDSHALMYLTPMARIARANGWQLVTMTKSACPPLVGLFGTNQWDVDHGRSCLRWQRHVLARLRRHPPDLIVYAETPAYMLRRLDGSVVKPWKRAGEWRRALKRTVGLLPPQTQVLALGGAPRNFGGNLIKCLMDHPHDISACQSRRQPVEARTLDQGLSQAASVTRAIFHSMYDSICTYDPCPLIQGRVLMWRDGSHLSETFVRRLRPLLEPIIKAALAGPPEGSATALPAATASAEPARPKPDDTPSSTP